jgi:cytochrome c
VRRKMFVSILLASACGAAQAATPEASAPPRASISAAEQTCRACHSIDTTKVGPPFKAIAERYRGDADAVAKLSHSMLQGSSGKWNTGAQMPPNAITQEEAERFAKWILGLK